MALTRPAVFLGCAGTMLLGVLADMHQGHGQQYPSKPIRMLTAEAGSGADLMARLVAQGLTASFGKQVLVDNRGAASGAVAAEILVHAAPDGYTLLFYGPSVWLLPLMRDNVPFDPLRDFAPVTLPMTQPGMLVVHPAVAVKSVEELIALAKAQPGVLNYSSGGIGSAQHLAAELFKSMAGVSVVRIGYGGAGSALNSVIAGQVQMMFPGVPLGMPQVKAGRLRALAVTSAEPTALAPGLPTLAASGLPGYESVLMLGMFAAAKTSPQLLLRLQQEVAKVLALPAVKDKLAAAGAEGVAYTPAQFAAVLKNDVAKWSKVIKEAGIRDQ